MGKWENFGHSGYEKRVMMDNSASTDKVDDREAYGAFLDWCVGFEHDSDNATAWEAWQHQQEKLINAAGEIAAADNFIIRQGNSIKELKAELAIREMEVAKLDELETDFFTCSVERDELRAENEELKKINAGYSYGVAGIRDESK